MKMNNLIKNKIMIVGCPGAGKSYFARQLRDITGIPVYYMDKLFWRENWTHVSREELLEEIGEVLKKDKRIIDGNYQDTMEIRMKEAEIIFFLDIDEETCLKSERERRGIKREDLPDYLIEEYDPEFIEYIKAYKNEGRIFTLILLEENKDKDIYVFKSREEKELFLDKLKKYDLSSDI